MSFFKEFVILIIGFILLIKGADYFVEGSAAVAKRLRVPTLIIGMTIVAMGTSAPECAVSIAAAIKGQNELAISNVVGSNIFNLMVVCGVCAILMPLTIQINTVRREFPFSILVGLLLLVFGYLGFQLGRVEGIIMLILFVIFLIWMVKSGKESRDAASEIQELEEDIKVLPGWKCGVYIILGCIAIVFGGDMVVDSASAIAALFGLSQNLIGLTIVAVGTSLPELVTSVVAAKKKEVDMALGNVIGSNIFNVLLVLGMAAAISPIAVTMENIIDLIVLASMSFLVFLFTVRKLKINKGEGIFMVILYGVYVVYICLR